jgi:hypothetical protein
METLQQALSFCWDAISWFSSSSFSKWFSKPALHNAEAVDRPSDQVGLDKSKVEVSQPCDEKLQS